MLSHNRASWTPAEPPVLNGIETHVVEKFHAYTMPRARPNSRVKDLPDIALLATAPSFDSQRLGAALDQTFTFRSTHALPTAFPTPLEAWTTPYARPFDQTRPVEWVQVFRRLLRIWILTW